LTCSRLGHAQLQGRIQPRALLRIELIVLDEHLPVGIHPDADSPVSRRPATNMQGGGPSPPRYSPSFEIRVDQFPRIVRVLPQVKFVLTNSANVHVCATYSEAIQMESPSTAAAP
jgi:hypothetical protein